jgi:hypothetical protein
MKDISPQCIKIGEVEGEGLIEFSVSKIKKWRGCQQAHDYKYVDKLRPKKKAVALRRGTWIHSCLEAKDVGGDWTEVLKKLKKEEYEPLFLEEKAELGDLPMEVFRIMRAYQQTWAKVELEYETVRVEQDFMIRVEGTPFVLTGKIDRIMKQKANGKIWCMEHKTMAKGIPTEDFRMSDVQTGVYIWVMEKLAPYLGYKASDIAGVMFDYIKTKPPTIPDVLKDGSMSKKKIDCDRWTYMACLKKEGLDPKDYIDFLKKLDENVFFVRIPLTKSKKMVSQIMKEFLNSAKQIYTLSGKCVARNLSFTCDRPKCEYRDLCIADLQGLDTEMLIKLNFVRGDEKDDGKDAEGESDDC